MTVPEPLTRPAEGGTSHGLGVAQGAALSIGAVLGTGVIALPALGARVAGPASLLAWAILVALSVPLAVTFAALGARYPDSGGVSTYVRTAFGAGPATVVGWCFYFAVAVGAPPAAMFGGAYVAAAFGGGRRTTVLTAVAEIVVVTAMNAGGVRLSGRVQLVLAGLLGALLLAATLTALPHAQLANLRPFAPHGWFAVVSAAALLVWGFAGWEAVTSLAGEYRRPVRDLPLATGIAVVVIGVLYLGVAATSVLVLGPAAGQTPAPLADLLAVGLGDPARALTAVVALVLTLGTMNAYFAGAAKLGAALGRDRALPAWFAHGSAAGQVPRRSLFVIAGLAFGSLVVTTVVRLDLTKLVLLTTGSFVLVYVLSTAAAIRLLPAGGWARRAAAVAFVSVLSLFATTGWYMLWALGISAGALLYARRADSLPQ
ncbi:APC family permease [Flindersiella endophytica]